jgi:hypothetical protein
MTNDGWGNGWRDDPDDNKVGYKKPPKHSRFKPGQSGNPNGRKRGRKDSKTLFREVLSEIKEITENGVIQKMPLEKVIYKSVAMRAAKGEPAATKEFLKLIEQYGLTEELDPGAREMVIRLVRPDGQDKK